jgi:hypothetical protein
MSVGERYGVCTRSRPLVVKLGGPASSEGLPGLAFTPDFPCGMTADATGAGRVALQRIPAWRGCLGDDCSPHALVDAAVGARDRVVTAGQITPDSPDGCEGRTSEMAAKLAITACGWRYPVFIDSDSRIVVPAGPAEIDVLVPVGFSMTSQVVAGETDWTDISIRVSGCGVSCCEVDGAFTQWLFVDPAGELADRMVLRPRRAHTLQVSAVDAAGALVNVPVRFYDHGTTSAPLGGNTLQQGFPLALLPIGAASYIELVPAAGATVMLRWGIK